MAPLMAANGQDEALLDTGPSLQDAFKQFRMRKRQQQRQVPTKVLRRKAAERRAADPAGDKARLREKFIAKCLESIGVPYAERYHKPGDELYGRASRRGRQTCHDVSRAPSQARSTWTAAHYSGRRCGSSGRTSDLI